MVDEGLVVPDLLRVQAARRPAQVALIVDGARSITYGEWEERSNAAGRGLTARGVRRGDRVGLVFENRQSLDYAVAEMAVWKAGAVSVPLNPCIDAPSQIVERLAAVGAECLVSPEEVVVSGWPGWSTALEDLETGRDVGPYQVRLGESDLMSVVFTSGTGQQARAVAVPHANLTFAPVWLTTRRPVRTPLLQGSLVSQASTLFTLIRPLLAEAQPSLTLSAFDPELFCTVVARLRVSTVALVPYMARELLRSEEYRRHDLSCLEVFRMRVAPSTPTLLDELADAFPRAKIFNVYSSTEAAPAATLMSYRLDARHTVGRPGPGSEMLVLRPDGQVAAPGEVGEPCLRHLLAAPRSYYRDPEGTAHAFPDGWARMGDIGYVDDDGCVVLLDRIRDRIEVGGELVSSLRVEAVLAEHPAVDDVAVVGLEGGGSGPVVAAAVVAMGPLTTEELLSFAAARLEPHEVPTLVSFLEAIPRRKAGKVDKITLRSDLASRQAVRP